MFVNHYAQYAVFMIAVTALVRPAGSYMARVFDGYSTPLDPLLRPVERGIYWVMGTSADEEMEWKQYAVAFIIFSLIGAISLYWLLRLQEVLPGGPDSSCLSTPLSPDLSANTAISFATTTTWQAYGGETTMKYWTQVIGLAGQNFMAGASGLAIGIAFIRAFARKNSETIGNFWVDLIRATLWILLPLSLIGSLLLVAIGVPMNFHPYTTARTIEGAIQIIPQGPVAALEFIKNLGTNGGGFFNANGAHPFENPSGLSNFIGVLAIAVLPAALTHTFGRMTGRLRAGWALYWVMAILFVAGMVVCDIAERGGISSMASNGVSIANTGNMEGKEVRFGHAASMLAIVTTSNGATGSYNCMHDSLTPIGGAVPLTNMLLGEITFGGLGTGIYSMVMVILVGLFTAGLMVGRTPEYIGKRLGPAEMKPIAVFTLLTPLAVLPFTALALVTHAGLAGLTTNSGPHGLTEVLFAYASCCANNGQAMAGLTANTPFYNATTAAVMMAGRFGLAIPALALAGLIARQGRRVITAGTLPSDTPLFGVVALGSALVVVALNFLPALVLGPILEHLLMRSSTMSF